MAASPTPPLPIYAIQESCIDALTHSNRLVLEAPTGSGKSTQVPQMLVDSNLIEGEIVVLQPRRLAARMLARRVASERSCALGSEVGYQVRFDRKRGTKTRIVYETDGILMRQLLSDPSLSKVGAIVFDEFHERHLYADIMLALAMRLQATRPELKIIVMSATLDSQALETYLQPCTVLRSDGRTFPVDISYQRTLKKGKPEPVWVQAATACRDAVQAHPGGDTLIFMPGAFEIRKTIQMLQDILPTSRFDIMPLYGDLSPDQQDRVVTSSDKPKIVVSTNIAETSITIEGVTLVIDSGLARKSRFDPHRGINTLLVEKISKASSDQRAGRAGRVRPGHCIRLWSESDHRTRPTHDAPEVQSVDLCETLLALSAHGINDPSAFNWLDAPDPTSLARSVQLLSDLGARDDSGLTELGQRMLAFPMHPRYSRMFVAGEYFGCLPRVALATALLQERSILLRTTDKGILERRDDTINGPCDSDVLTLCAAFDYAESHRFDTHACQALGIHAGGARQCARLRDQFIATAERLGMDISDANPDRHSLLRCLLTGFSDQVAVRTSEHNSRCELVHKRKGSLEKSSIVTKAPLIVASEIAEIGGRGRNLEVRLSLVSAIQQTWLESLFPDEFRHTSTVEYDPTSKRVRAFNETRFRDLCIDRSRAEEPTLDHAAEVLASEVLNGTITIKGWSEKVDVWFARVNLIARHCPDLCIPEIDQSARQQILEHICHGAMGAKELRQKDVWPAVYDWLSYEQKSAVISLAPERITLSNGRTPKVVYALNDAPYIAMRVQELYDVTATPTLAMGAVTPRVQVLAPNQRVVQITEDLASFWRTSYPQIKKDLKGRYPKHEWR